MVAQRRRQSAVEMTRRARMEICIPSLDTTIGGKLSAEGASTVVVVLGRADDMSEEEAAALGGGRERWGGDGGRELNREGLTSFI